MMITWGIAALFGLAIAMLILGGRSWLTQRFEQDVAWAADVSLRFNPNPVNARRRVATFYALYIAVLAMLILITPHPLFALGIWLVLLTLPRIIVQAMWVKRREKIDQQLPAAIAAMANSLRAGLTLVQAMQRLAEHAPEPIRVDFQVMVNRYAYGASLDATIREAKQRLQLPNFNLFASALLLNREMGGDASETLSRISQSLDKLHQMHQTVEAHTSEGRTNIKVLLIAPVLLLLMLGSADTEGLKMLFTTSQGYAVLLVAGALMGTGVYFAAKITRSEV
jgi:tight adherence protein B